MEITRGNSVITINEGVDNHDNILIRIRDQTGKLLQAIVITGENGGVNLSNVRNTDSVADRLIYERIYSLNDGTLEGRLSDKLVTLLKDSAKTLGTFDPVETLCYVGECLNVKEHVVVEMFLEWIVKNNRTFGHNIQEVYAEYLLEVN